MPSTPSTDMASPAAPGSPPGACSDAIRGVAPATILCRIHPGPAPDYRHRESKDMSDQKNLLIAIVLRLATLRGFQFLYEMPRVRQQQAQQHQTETAQPSAQPGTPPAAQGSTPTGAAPTAAQPAAGAPIDRATALAAVPRIKIDTPRLSGSIALAGGRVDDIALKDYRETVDPDSPNIVLLSPIGTHDPYHAEFGWEADQPGVKQPDADTLCTPDQSELTTR